jgi:hypothetical protein
MTKIASAISFTAVILAFLFQAGAADATQLSRTWVSGLGSDSNPCTRALPCSTFAGAYANTAAGGEIDVLDGGDFGRLVIQHAITVANDGTGTAAIAPAATNISPFLIVAGPADVIVLRGLDLDGTNSQSSFPGATPGIAVQGGSLLVDHCTIHDFRTSPGIGFWPGPGESLWVRDTLFLNDGASNLGSLLIESPALGTGRLTAHLERVQIFNAIGNGIRIESMASTGPVDVEFHDVTVDGSSGGSGIVVVSDPGSTLPATIVADNVTSSHNAGYGLRAVGATASVFLSRSTITGNGVGIGASGGGAIFSYGDNRFAGNTGGNGVTPTPIGLK